MLKVGDLAPKFKAKDLFDNEISMDETGNWTFVSFHRFAACPFCALRTRELINNYPLFERKNIDIISIWPSSKRHMLKYVGSEKPPFPLVADNTKAVFKKYHVTKSNFLSSFKLFLHPLLVFRALKGKFKNMEVDADPNLLPAEFLISPKGEIAISYYGKHFGDHLSVSHIIKITSAQLHI